jgi:hypothetical protein
MRTVRVTRDGGCLFRSLAVALFYQTYGVNLGKGQVWGRETTARQIAHNTVARWVRTLIVASLAGHRGVTPRTTFGRMNFLDAAENAYSLLEAFPKGKRLDPRVLRGWKRSLAPEVPRGLFGDCAEPSVYWPENVPGDVLTLSGRYRDETHRAYCRRMLRLCEWGGESELFVASKVFGVRIVVWGEGHRPMVAYGDKTSMPLHVRLAEEHYDAYV